MSNDETNDFIEFENNKNSIKENNNINEFVPDISIKDKYPWWSKATIKIKNVNIRFHNEIINFYNYIKPNKEDIESRKSSIKELENIIKQDFHYFVLYTFGSFKTKLFLKNSDVDVCIFNENFSSKKLLLKVYSIIKKYEGERYEDIQCIPHAKVPILKLYDNKYKISIDIIFNKNDGIEILEPMLNNLKKYKQLKYIIMIFKYFLKVRGLNETYTGGIGSFLLYNMVLAFYNFYVKQLLKKYDDNVNKLNDISLSQFFLQFLEFYIFSFNYHNLEIHMKNTPVIKDRYTNDNSFFNLYSPQDNSHNLGSAAYNFKIILSVLRNRYCLIKNKDLGNDVSILKYFVNPKDVKFTLNV